MEIDFGFLFSGGLRAALGKSHKLEAQLATEMWSFNFKSLRRHYFPSSSAAALVRWSFRSAFFVIVGRALML